MKLSIHTESYNERRYGKPWIAVVDFEDNTKGNFEFGAWIGQNGCEGLLEIEAGAGDIIAKGQRDTRKMSNSAPDFYILEGDGSLKSVSKVEAYEHYKSREISEEAANPLANFSNEELLTELKKRNLI